MTPLPRGGIVLFATLGTLILGTLGLSYALLSVSPDVAVHGECRKAPPALVVENPEEDLNRVEQITSSIKQVTSQAFCNAVKNFDFDGLAAYIAPDALLERLYPDRVEPAVSSRNGWGGEVRCDGNCFGSRDAFLSDLRRLTSAWMRVDRCYFKPFHVRATRTEPRQVSADFQFWLGGATPDGARTMEKSNVTADLAQDEAGNWQIRRLQFLRRERFQSPRPAFSDRTDAARLPTMWSDTGYDASDIAYGQVLFGGVAVGDFDGDGWPDIYLCRAGKSILLRNDRHGGFQDVTDAAGVGNIGNAQAALFADFDNDGYPDLFVVNASYSVVSDSTMHRGTVLYRNNGNGTFTRVPQEFGPVGPASGASAADFDGDGRLDLYLTYYQDENLHPFHSRVDAHDGVGNRLFRNLGNMRFEDVTAHSGTGGDAWSFASSWADYDGDGKIDLYVANDFGQSYLFRNRGDGTFQEMAAAAGTSNPANGMSADWGDFDNDGRPDLYVSNMYTHFGNIFLPLSAGLQGDARKKLEFGVHGNRLYRNEGNGHFREVGGDLGVNEAGWAWGSNFLDYDNDGWLDIHVANGYWAGAAEDDA